MRVSLGEQDWVRADVRNLRSVLNFVSQGPRYRARSQGPPSSDPRKESNGDQTLSFASCRNGHLLL